MPNFINIFNRYKGNGVWPLLHLLDPLRLSSQLVREILERRVCESMGNFSCLYTKTVFGNSKAEAESH